jgi:hypothetical protein
MIDFPKDFFHLFLELSVLLMYSPPSPPLTLKRPEYLHPLNLVVNQHQHCLFHPFLLRKNPEKGRKAAAPSNIKEIQEVQGGQEASHDGGAIIPKDA